MRVLGVDLAWGEGNAKKAANETGVAALDGNGDILSAGWTIGLAGTVDWIERWAEDDTLLFVDAPLLVDNATGQRLCEREVGQCYWSWKVSANTTNLGSRNLAGVALRQTLGKAGWRYDDGREGPRHGGRVMSECYPYTSIVGAAELGFDVERPRYKRQPKGMLTTQSHPLRAAACDRLISACLKERGLSTLRSSKRSTIRVERPVPRRSTSLRGRASPGRGL